MYHKKRAANAKQLQHAILEVLTQPRYIVLFCTSTVLEHTIKLTKKGTVFFKYTKLCLSNLKLKAKVFILNFFFLSLFSSSCSLDVGCWREACWWLSRGGDKPPYWIEKLPTPEMGFRLDNIISPVNHLEKKQSLTYFLLGVLWFSGGIASSEVVRCRCDGFQCGSPSVSHWLQYDCHHSLAPKQDSLTEWPCILFFRFLGYAAHWICCCPWVPH